MLGGNRVIGWIYTNLKHEEWVWCREPGIWEVGLMMMMCDTWRPDCCTTDSTAAIRHTVNIVNLHPVIAFGLQWLCLTTLWGEWSVYLPYIKQIDGLFSGGNCWSVWSPGTVQGHTGLYSDHRCEHDQLGVTVTSPGDSWDWLQLCQWKTLFITLQFPHWPLGKAVM